MQLMQQMAGAQNPQLGQLFSQMAGGNPYMQAAQSVQPGQASQTAQMLGSMQQPTAAQNQQMMAHLAAMQANPQGGQQRQSMKNPGAGSTGPSTAGFGGQGGMGAPPPGMASALGPMGGPQTTTATRQMAPLQNAAPQPFTWQR